MKNNIRFIKIYQNDGRDTLRINIDYIIEIRKRRDIYQVIVSDNMGDVIIYDITQEEHDRIINHSIAYGIMGD